MRESKGLSTLRLGSSLGGCAFVAALALSQYALAQTTVQRPSGTPTDSSAESDPSLRGEGAGRVDASDARMRADQLFKEGKALLNARRYAQACPLLEESQRLDPASGTLINLADCYEHIGRRATAWIAFSESAQLASARGNPIRAEEARARATALANALPKVVLVLDGPPVTGLELRWDRAVLPRAFVGRDWPVEPGEHEIEVSATGRSTQRVRVSLPDGPATVTVNIPPPTPTAVSPTPAETSPTGEGLGARRMLALGAGGLGVLGIAIGSVMGLVSKSQHDHSFELCSANGVTCAHQDEAVDAMRSAQTSGTVSTAAFILGGVGLAAGVTLWLTSPTRSAESAPVGQPSAIGLRVGPGQLATEWRW